MIFFLPYILELDHIIELDKKDKVASFFSSGTSVLFFFLVDHRDGHENYQKYLDKKHVVHLLRTQLFCLIFFC